MERTLFPQLALGYRGFRVIGDRLGSVFQPETWIPGANEAHCLFQEHRAPTSRCECGFYALYDLDGIEAHEGYAIAAVVGWGDAELHAAGWRSQFAQVIALYYPRRRRGRRRVKAAARRYKVPCFASRDQLRAYAERFAGVPAGSARPEKAPGEETQKYIFGTPSRPLEELSVIALLVGTAVSAATVIAGFGSWALGAGSAGLWIGLAGALSFPVFLLAGYWLITRFGPRIII